MSGGFWDRLLRRGEQAERDEGFVVPSVPTSEDLFAALDRVEAMVAGGAAPAPVTSRVRRVERVVRDTIPRLPSLGAGSPQAYSVMATATDYLPEAVGAYLRLPRQFADSRPVDRGKSSLMVLIDAIVRCSSPTLTSRRVSFAAAPPGPATLLYGHGDAGRGPRIWLVSFMQYDLGYFDDETCRLERIENPFGPKVLPMSPE